MNTPKFSDAEQSDNHQSINSSAVDSARTHYSSSISDQEMGLRTDTDAEGQTSYVINVAFYIKKLISSV